MIYLKILGKQEQANPQISRKKERIKIGAEINEMETKRTLQRIKETKSWFLERINKIENS
jgi:hypothetical protein